MNCPICDLPSGRTSGVCGEHFPISLDEDGNIISHTECDIVQLGVYQELQKEC